MSENPARTRSVTSVLVANRGEIARRVFRSCRSMGLSCVAVYSDADTDAPYVAEADVAVRLPGVSPTDTYLDSGAVIAAALAAGADAVHPGYGFLSERASFAQAVIDAGLVWVGPSPAAIDAMGDKIRAKELVGAAGVPLLETVTFEETDAVDAASLDYPVLVKASAGGGGRGMRVVSSAGDLAAAVDGASREALSAFGDGRVFVETYLPTARHVEIQVFGDVDGTVLALGERECSIQRRHQKIVEEAPSPAVDGALRARMCAAAVAAASALPGGYTGAGTVEFLLGADGRFYFLEMNTRLQVEHPVTELVQGVDLVAMQLRVAAGESVLPLATEPAGHAIEVRLYAEDVVAGFLPSTGTLEVFEILGREPDGPSAGRYGVRVDTGVESGSVVSPHYDAMLAKVVAWAPSRTEAARRLAAALTGARLHGVTTNRDLLVAILRDTEFLAGGTDTAYLTRHEPAELGAPPASSQLTAVHAVAAALCAQAQRRVAATVQPAIPSGWRNVRSAPQVVDFVDGPSVGYAFGRGGSVEVTVDAASLAVRVLRCTSDLLDAEVGGLRRVVRVRRSGPVSDVDSSMGSSRLVVAPRHPLPGSEVAQGSLLAPMPGSVVAVKVEVGDEVVAGQTLLVLEAMKMEHAVKASSAGVVSQLPVAVGAQVESGAVLVVLDAGGQSAG